MRRIDGTRAHRHAEFAERLDIGQRHALVGWVGAENGESKLLAGRIDQLAVFHLPAGGAQQVQRTAQVLAVIAGAIGDGEFVFLGENFRRDGRPERFQ